MENTAILTAAFNQVLFLQKNLFKFHLAFPQRRRDDVLSNRNHFLLPCLPEILKDYFSERTGIVQESLAPDNSMINCKIKSDGQF